MLLDTLNLNRVFREGADTVRISPEVADIARTRLEGLKFEDDLMRPGVSQASFNRPRPPFPFSRLITGLQEQAAPAIAIFGREASAVSFDIRRVTQYGFLDWQQHQRQQAWLGFTFFFPEPGWRGTDGGVWELAKATLRDEDGTVSSLEVTQVNAMNDQHGLLVVYNPSSLAFRQWLSPVEGERALYMIEGTLGGLS